MSVPNTDFLATLPQISVTGESSTRLDVDRVGKEIILTEPRS